MSDLNGGIVLPDDIAHELLEKVDTVTGDLGRTFQELDGHLDSIRKAMLGKGHIVDEGITADTTSELLGLAVDGAKAVTIDRATTYGVTCVTRVGPDQSYSAFRSNVFMMPHLSEVEGLATGLMMMQEMMLAIESAKSHPTDMVFIDGSKVTFIIKVNQFYTAFRDEAKKDQLEAWREDAASSAGEIIRAFEKQNWFADFICLPNIVGLPKLVTTDEFARQYLPEPHKGRFDDKTLAALVLQPGERTRSVPLRNPESDRLKEKNPDVAPYHINEEYPYATDFETLSKAMTMKGSEHRIWHCYFNAPANNVIYKIEYPYCLGKEGLEAVLRWVSAESCSPGLLEPYSLYIADRFVSEAVAVCRRAISEIARTRMPTDWAWSLTGSYRSS